jgi:hypothetical protein
MDPFTGTLNKTKTKQLFFNAETDARFFDSTAYVKQVQEVRPEEPRVNPFAAIDERNAMLDQAHREAAMVSDSTQTLIKEPYATIVAAETVTLEELPHVVRQAAEAALLNRMKHMKTRGKR